MSSSFSYLLYMFFKKINWKNEIKTFKNVWTIHAFENNMSLNKLAYLHFTNFYEKKKDRVQRKSITRKKTKCLKLNWTKCKNSINVIDNN